MIAGATGARASVIMIPIANHGVEYLPGFIIVAGFSQLVLATMGCAKLVRLLGKPHMIGFLNGLAIIIASSQIQVFHVSNFDEENPRVPIDKDLPVEWITGVTLLLMFITVLCVIVIIQLWPMVPRIGKAVPGSLIGILFAMLLEHALYRGAFGEETPIIGEVAYIEGGLPLPFFADSTQYPNVPPFNWETFSTIAFPGFIAGAVGMIEAVMVTDVVSEMTKTPCDRHGQVLQAMGVGNMVCGFFGNMGGGTMIDLSTINCKAGASGVFRWSGMVAAGTVLLTVLVLSPFIKLVPTSSLVGVIAVAVYHTFDWNSLLVISMSFMPKKVRDHPRVQKITRFSSASKIPRADCLVIILIVTIVILVDLFTAVAIGVLFSALQFAWENNAELSVETQYVTKTMFSEKLDKEVDTEVKVYHITGPVFFGSARKLLKNFNFDDDPMEIEIHLGKSQLFDYTGIDTLNVLGEKYKQRGKNLHVRYLHSRSARLLTKADHLVTNFTYAVDIVVDDAEVELDAVAAGPLNPAM